MPQVKLKWIGKGEFVGTDSTNHSLVMSTQDADNATGLKPAELLLLALAGCTGVDMVSILRKPRHNLTGLEIRVTGEQDPDPPWTFRKMHLEYMVYGTQLSEHAVQRAIALSEKKYCPVHATISGVATVSSSFVIVDSEAEAGRVGGDE